LKVLSKKRLLFALGIQARNHTFVYMLRLITHIEHLLLTHDCIIVPELGGFVIQPASAVHSAEEHIFHPMHKEIMFNATLTHQDGLLSESYMKMYHTDYRDACLMVEEDVKKLKSRLQEQKNVDFGSVGLFSLGNEGQYMFTPSEKEKFSIDSYGLPSFYFIPLYELHKKQMGLSQPTKRRRNRNIRMRISRNFPRAGAGIAVVVAVALILLISFPVKDVDKSTYTASAAPIIGIIAPVSGNLTVSSDSEESVMTEGQSVQPEIPTTEPSVRTKTYYVVIGSFLSEEQAEKYIAGVDKAICHNVNYIRKERNNRVYAGKFNNREEAESYIRELRSTDDYKNAWLFIDR